MLNRWNDYVLEIEWLAWTRLFAEVPLFSNVSFMCLCGKAHARGKSLTVTRYRAMQYPSEGYRYVRYYTAWLIHFHSYLPIVGNQQQRHCTINWNFPGEYWGWRSKRNLTSQIRLESSQEPRVENHPKHLGWEHDNKIARTLLTLFANLNISKTIFEACSTGPSILEAACVCLAFHISQRFIPTEWYSRCRNGSSILLLVPTHNQPRAVKRVLVAVDIIVQLAMLDKSRM